MPADTGKPREENQLAFVVTDRNRIFHATGNSALLWTMHWVVFTEFMPWSLLQCSVKCPIKKWYLEWRTQLTSI